MLHRKFWAYEVYNYRTNLACIFRNFEFPGTLWKLRTMLVLTLNFKLLVILLQSSLKSCQDKDDDSSCLYILCCSVGLKGLKFLWILCLCMYFFLLVIINRCIWRWLHSLSIFLYVYDIYIWLSQMQLLHSWPRISDHIYVKILNMSVKIILYFLRKPLF